jgi:hypothetical protein
MLVEYPSLAFASMRKIGSVRAGKLQYNFIPHARTSWYWFSTELDVEAVGIYPTTNVMSCLGDLIRSAPHLPLNATGGVQICFIYFSLQNFLFNPMLTPHARLEPFAPFLNGQSIHKKFLV